MNKPHLFFRNPVEGTSKLKSRPGGIGSDEKEKDQEPKDYRKMADNFSNCLSKYESDHTIRVANRTEKVSKHFDVIELTFFAGFDEVKYKPYYIDKFGLELLHLSHFNRKGLFAIEDEEKFESFFEQLKIFINNQGVNDPRQFDSKILFIKSFKLFSTNDRLGNINTYEVIHLSFMGNGSFIDNSVIAPQKDDLVAFLDDHGINYEMDDFFGELYHIDEATLRFILDNFDFIYATCSGSGAIITPGKFNAPKREYGFEVTNPDKELPIIGIIDTGVSAQTPLAPLLNGEDGEFDATGSGSFNDLADHGTGVAAFAAFGKKLIPGYQGQVEADAKILPIKLIDGNSGPISQKQVVSLIRDAHLKYNVRIFTLTIGYSEFPLNDNQEFSSYAAMLDQLASELDILIFISTTNHFVDNLAVKDYPDKFKEPTANIAPPAESMNNITIGATADNFESCDVFGLAGNKNHPALYSRKFHYNYEDGDVFNKSTRNKYLLKPDILIGGGDYHEKTAYGFQFLDEEGKTCLEVLSSDLSERTFKALGTSYSTPIAANFAARLLQTYPDLNMQSIKALLINASEEIQFGEVFNDFSKILKYRIGGYGILNDQILFSTDDKVTMVVEDSVAIDEIKLFPIKLPEYLNEAQRKKGVLKFTTTLCFRFQPKTDHQLLYCPFHVSYAIGRNVPLDDYHFERKKKENGKVFTKVIQDGYNGGAADNFKIADKGWIQDFYYREKIVSNVQKHGFNAKCQDIIDEENTFKLAVNAAFHKTLTEEDKEMLDKEVPFSLVITVEQQPNKDEQLDSLYDGLVAINELEAIGEIEQEADIENKY